jgi:hypothetical protein
VISPAVAIIRFCLHIERADCTGLASRLKAAKERSTVCRTAHDGEKRFSRALNMQKTVAGSKLEVKISQHG